MNHLVQPPLAFEKAHRNHYLFSDHYLDSLLPAEDPRWLEALPEAERLLAGLKRLLGRVRPHQVKYSEAQLESVWFQPVLWALGHKFAVQATIPALEQGITKPDYIFFPDEASAQAATNFQNTKEYARNALAVGEVKKWGVALGKKDKEGGASFDKQNPMYQIDTYLRATGLDWGILSNGQVWRLVHRSSSHQLTVYYEVDLLELLQGDDAGRFRYFTLFFRQAAFRPDSQGHIFLQDALDASRRYAVELEADLQENVYQALQHLIQGFLDLGSNQLGAEDLPTIYENSLYLLYRLLFILYAESRGLLPLEQEQYREHYSLHDIKRDIAQGNMPTLPYTHDVWDKLQTLFRIINGDNEALNRALGVPRYNGGLFDPAVHPFLHEKKISDAALVQAIDLLSRRETVAGREFVDYRTLGVRQLGSIYEGLLEYHPRLRHGRVELVTDKGERKATGSYYTPEYIVQYIVENTLGPLVEEATERVRQRSRAATSEASKEAEAQNLVNEILRLKVLDPAMGSGHFLVSATDYLAVALATDPYVQTEYTPEEDVVYWRRRVVERCIYGVDKNPLAVELAKLSLWLATVARDRPLSFLDHHLKCGDALVGASPYDAGFEPPVILSKRSQKQLEQRKAGQLSFFQTRLTEKLPAVMGKVLEITGRESDSYDAVQSKEAADEAVRQLKAPFEAVANLWTSAYFGNDFTVAEYDAALEAVGQPDKLLAQPAVQRAQQIAAERRFFHWELAFPEVFYDAQGQSLGETAGFNAVIGNPPYGFIDSLPWFKKYQNDAFVYFWVLAINVCRLDGLAGLITPTAWLTGVSYTSLRELMLDSTQLMKIVSLPYDVFPDAYIDTCVVTARKGHSTVNPVKTKKMEKREDARNVAHLEYLPIDPELWRTSSFSKFILNTEVLGLNRFDSDPHFIELGEIIRVERGVQLYSRSKHSKELIAADFLRVLGTPPPQAAHLYLPELLGEELSRYSILPKKRSWLEYSERLASKRDIDYFTKPRVTLRRLLTRRRELQAAMTSERLITTDNILNILVEKSDYSEGFITALLNSKLLSWVYTHSSAISIKDDFPQVTYEELKRLPIPRINFILSADDRKKYSGKAGKLYKQFCQKDDYDCVLGFVDHHLSQQPEQSDVVHDLLAFLAEQMIALNKQKQQLVADFWLDLRGVTEPDTFAKLRDKGKWEESLAKDAALQPFVNPTSRSTRTLDESLGWNEAAYIAFLKQLAGSVPHLSKLVKVYQEYAGEYGRVSRQLAQTDALIDRVVYRLYGLTEEEIAVVEAG